MLQLYSNIKSRRLALGMTQSELAEKMGYADKSMIAKIEKGSVDLQQSKIFAFADILGVSASDLMGTDGLSCSAPLSLSPTEERIITAYRAADSITQAMVQRVLNVEPVADPDAATDIEDDEKVEAFRKHLELQRQVRERSAG